MTNTVEHWHPSGTARALVRLMVIAMVVIPSAVFFGERIVVALLPVFGAVFEWIAGDFKLLRLAVDHEGADHVVRATVMWKHIVFIGGHVIYPDPRGEANASTLVAHVLQGPLAALLMVSAWPVAAVHGRSMWKELVVRALVLCPLLAFLICADVPVVLAGELWQLVFDALAPGAGSALIYWKNFLQGGGRYALAVVFATVSIDLGRRVLRQTNEHDLDLNG